MRRAEGRHLHVPRLQHNAILGDILGDQQRPWIGPAFIRDAGLDVELVQFPIGFGHRLDTLWTE